MGGQWEDIVIQPDGPKALVKEKQGITSHERVPALTKLCGSLAITNQEEANLLAEVFSEEMRTLEPDKQPPPFLRLATPSIESVVITEAAVRRRLKGGNVRKVSGRDGVSLYLLKHCGRAHHALPVYFPPVPGDQGVGVSVERGKGHTRSIRRECRTRSSTT